ncbi:pectin lyase-like protein [Neocallimastix lanati (nom. inval.)]|jgi:pectate lyase|uniref:Pectin lyase-like protein n=1 Tax=Neocallimastix californiae TaxID=1754190 RepID=A0A1Y2D9R7_9FUNG|nr:pectin lyase-like protein [Neocallimastix sp. JGI-2020a]ORY56000.1 pectin lyase-like protein [Neocallimastix californiae]|eukprot:ORY56000.1 pectin lyase-like protein [Neocallimastix californiae]
MKLSKLNFIVLSLATFAKASSPIGFGKNTFGGNGGVEYHVNNMKEFQEALNNNGNPNGSKIIYIDSQINGALQEDGSLLTAESLSPGFTFQKYVACFTEDGSEWLNTDECNVIEELRSAGAKVQANKIKVMVTPNTTIIGNGEGSKLEELSLQINGVSNVIIKNLFIEAPNDLFPEWDPTDGIHGSWNSEYDAIVIRRSINVWIDNCYLTDGNKGVDTTPLVFGQYIDLHDGLIDIVNESDFVTISNNRFENHKKTILIGSSDKNVEDRGHLKITIYNNVFLNCNERLPRVRFGHVHVYNNYYYAETFNPGYPSLTVDNYFHDDAVFPQYFIGLGVEGNVLSEYNSFNYIGNQEIPATDDIIVYSYGGYIFHDNGSEYNGQNIDIDSLAEKSFKLKVKTKVAQNAEKGSSNPIWVNATFTNDAFHPSSFYDYNLMTNLDEVNDLINKVPSWMFGEIDNQLEVSNNNFDYELMNTENVTYNKEPTLEDIENIIKNNVEPPTTENISTNSTEQPTTEDTTQNNTVEPPTIEGTTQNNTIEPIEPIGPPMAENIIPSNFEQSITEDSIQNNTI